MAVRKIWRKEFAIHVKGLKQRHDPRGSVGTRSRPCNCQQGACQETSMMAVQAFEGFSFRHINAGIAFQVVWFENLFAAINNLETCQLTSNSVVGKGR
ncbi:MAG: aldehyde ferredoxin oxidoreductase C-terminal domain-containing protein [Bacteroidales bacterium]